MTFTAYGFKTITHIGSVAGEAGTNRALHAYVTNDDAAAVETANYFDGIYKRLKVGDAILASLDMAGTPTLRLYVVSDITAGAVTIARETTTVTGDQDAVTPTGVDLTDNSAGTPADTIAALADGTTYATDVAAIRSNFASLARAADRHTADIAAIVARLEAAGLLTPA